MKIAAKKNDKVDHGRITSLSDKGVYTVIAENSFGKREEHGTLKVEGLYLSMNCLYLLQKQKSI
jgi:hypothetical protein